MAHRCGEVVGDEYPSLYTLIGKAVRWDYRVLRIRVELPEIELRNFGLVHLPERQARQCRFLLRVGDLRCGSEVLRTPIVAKVRNGAIDLASELLGRKDTGKAAEVSRKHGFPIDRYLPRSCLVGEEDDPVRLFVDVSE